MRRIGLQDIPEALRLVALGGGHVVFDVTAGREVVLRERCGIGGRTPPALELAGICPQLPDTLRRGVELSIKCHGEGVGILADGGDGHGFVSLLRVMMSVMRSTRSR